MSRPIRIGDCARIPDGRVGRLGEKSVNGYNVRVRRMTSKTHQFLLFSRSEIKPVDCPRGWMSPDGYNRYLKITLAKMRRRNLANSRLREQ